MSASKNSKKTTRQAAAAQVTREFETDVLFQKICNKWYAFSVVEGECLMTEVPKEHLSAFSTKAKAK